MAALSKSLERVKTSPAFKSHQQPLQEGSHRHRTPNQAGASSAGTGEQGLGSTGQFTHKFHPGATTFPLLLL